jgi:hypothetical protein
MTIADVEFAVGNYFDKGSIAPYNTVDGVFGTGFEDDFVMEALDGTPVSTLTEDDFMPASSFWQIYERENSTANEAKQATYVIVRGHFEGAAAWSYYKLDIANNEDRKLIDLQRNHRYTININEVSNDGHDNLTDAVNGTASNNIEANIVVGDYPSISDGTNVLEVQGTSFTYMESGREFQIWYRYTTYDAGGYGTVDNTLDEDPVLVQTDDRHVVEAGSITVTPVVAGQTYGLIRGRTSILGATVNDATITITKGMLSRTIKLQLRPVMDFEILRTDPVNHIVDNAINAPVSITFKLPDNISASLLPLPVRIYTRKLTPRPKPAPDMSIAYGDGEFWYVYNAAPDEDGNPKAEYTLDFVSNSTRTDEVVTLAADRFNDAYVRFGNVNFMNVSMTSPRRVANAPVDINFTIPADYWAENEECVVTFNTTNLAPRAGNPSGLITDGNNTYRLTVPKPTTRAAGDVLYTALFQTSGTSTTSPPSATLSAPGFNDATVSATRLYDYTTNPQFRIAGNNNNWTTAQKPRDNNNTDMRVYFRLSQAGTANPVTVTLVAPGVTLRNGSGRVNNITQSGDRITMTVTTTQEAYFTVRTGTRNTNIMTFEATGYATITDLNAP